MLRATSYARERSAFKMLSSGLKSSFSTPQAAPIGSAVSSLFGAAPVAPAAAAAVAQARNAPRDQGEALLI